MVFFFIITVVVLSFDVITKAWVNRNLEIGQKIEIVKNRVCLWHIKNKGITYNKFEKYPHWIVGISAGMISLLLIGFLSLIREGKRKWMIFSLALFMGGAFGNFVERIRKQHVTDFLYIKGKGLPVFNIADVFIVVGGLFLVMSSSFGKQN